MATSRRKPAPRSASDAALGSESDFRRLVEHADDHAIFLLDPTGQVASWNSGAQRILGHAREEIVGQHYSRLHPAEALARKQPEIELEMARRDGAIESEGWLQRKDGSEFWANFALRVLRDEGGEVRGFSCILRDATIRKRSEESMRWNDERFRLLVEGVKEYSILMLDPTGHVASWNAGAEKIKGYTADEIIGKHFSCFYPPEAIELGWPDFELGVARADGRFEDEGWRVRKDGTRFWANVVITPLFHPDGMLFGYAKVTRDLTERKRIQELEDTERQMSEFLAMLAHELRNPLAPIRNAVAVMRMNADAASLSWCRDVVERQVRHLSRLIDDLLDVTRIKYGKIQLHKQPVDLVAAVAQAVEATRSLVEQREHSLSVALFDEPIWVQADPTRISQVIVNLLDNAAKYTPKKGHITISVSRTGDVAVVRVQDDGVGIAPELLPRIFELFTQGDRSMDRTEGGLGIGLTVVRRLIELHGGIVSVVSKGAGKGSEFTVRLPVLSASALRASREGVPRAEARPSTRRILVVDDNKDAAESLAMLVRLAGHDVRTAHDGMRGLGLARELVPDFVVLDLGLPGMNGYELARKIREIPALERVKLIALTGYSSEEDRRRTSELGFIAHIAKPIDPQALARLFEGEPK